jgi:hypothetical protein
MAKRRNVGGVSTESMVASRKRWVSGSDPVDLARSQCMSRAFRGRKRGYSEDRHWWRLSDEQYRFVVGVCGYCGVASYGLVRKDLSGVWEMSNVLCCCGVCGRMRAGLSHRDFVEQVGKIASSRS